MKSALFHVIVPFLICITLANTSLFDRVKVDLTYDHYAEKVVDYFPFLIAMPFNSLINIAYMLMGLFWLLKYRDKNETKDERYTREVFALMAIFYAPVQWWRLAVLQRAPAVLDQWFTLPIFAWVPIWINFIQDKTTKKYAFVAELCSILSYGLSLKFEWGFETALGCHVFLAIYKGTQVQLRLGNHQTFTYLVLAMLSCAGFVVLKLLDHWLAQFWIFQRMTGHFWSKVCDVLQFHYSFCFLTTLTQITHKAKD
ncbi:transmembrane protein 187 [Boleophthalmus pectinirostris]|uniref:transmembrane protein 187 n=1 Tax=Boleophthalmus pectinirostris TaxID=150288 RepID=UPI000A1C5FCE|nr:transmembrane protein 187 [Boleophthalmus pectinirostris]